MSQVAQKSVDPKHGGALSPCVTASCTSWPPDHHTLRPFLSALARLLLMPCTSTTEAANAPREENEQGAGATIIVRSDYNALKCREKDYWYIFRMCIRLGKRNEYRRRPSLSPTAIIITDGHTFTIAFWQAVMNSWKVSGTSGYTGLRFRHKNGIGASVAFMVLLILTELLRGKEDRSAQPIMASRASCAQTA